jgi:large conductance mechanosensitive channel
MGMTKEFRDFAIKGNVIDLAIGVVIGAAFTSIVNSLIEHVITPMVLQPVLKAAHLTDLKDLTIFGTVKIGLFLSSVISFLLVAWVLFLVVKAVNAAKKKDMPAEPAAPAGPTQEQLLTEIRDLLKEQQKK